MSPYYSDGSVTIYHGDCRDLLDDQHVQEAGPYDLLLTDPPYGVGSWSATGGNSLSAEEVSAINRWDVAPTKAALDAALGLCRVAVVWGGNYLAGSLGACRMPLVWDKGIRGMHFADGEYAWTNFPFGTLRIFRLDNHKSDARGARAHPTQKPVELMKWCMEMSRTTGPILDPFCGSGTTLRAAKDLGFRSVGIEIEERYCEIAAERCRQEVLDLGVA